MKKAREHGLSRLATTLINHIAVLATTPKGCPQSREQMLADWAIKRRTLEMAAKELCDLNLLTLQHRKGHHVFYHIPDGRNPRHAQSRNRTGCEKYCGFTPDAAKIS